MSRSLLRSLFIRCSLQQWFCMKLDVTTEEQRCLQQNLCWISANYQNRVHLMPICDASDNVLFPDETTRKTCLNSGPISLSNSWCQGNLGINTADGSWRVITVLRTQHEVRYAFQKMEQTTKHAPMDNSFPHSSAHVSLGLRRTDQWQCIPAIKSVLQSVVDLLMEQRCCLHPLETC